MTELTGTEVEKLIRKAEEMLAFAYTPYSGFKVGAALLAADGTVYGGCNIENASFTPANCAERTAFFKAVSEGKRAFRAIAIVGGKNGIQTGECAPCGVCRQVMREFCDPDTFLVITKAGPDDYRVRTLKEYLTLSFGPENLL